MRINRLRLHNFKKFDEAVFQFHPEFTVLIGDNATGKTSILDALAILLGTYLLRAEISTGRSGFGKDDVRFIVTEKKGQVFLEPQKDVFIESQAIFREQIIDWRRNPGDRGGSAKQLRDAGAEDFTKISKGEDVDLPVLLYYGVCRLCRTHRDVEIGKPESKLVGYRNCLDPQSDYHLFKKWFKQLELVALQQGKRIPALEVVRTAVKTCIPDADHFYYDVANDQLMIRFGKTGLMPFDNLSDGYRNMLGMVADIAHRLSRLNPHKGENAAQKGAGVVLIDEIDLHLHPKWQRRVVRDLQKAFPALQFIATTHSPFILQSLDPGEVIDLNQSGQGQDLENKATGIAAPSPADSFSNRSIEDIVETVMGVALPQRSARYQEMYKVAKEYYKILQEAKNGDAKLKDELKQRMDELSAPFSDNIAYHAFLEMERLAAGLGRTNKPEEK
jgi:predicted ATP-binding protein involved in virulence